MTSSRLFRFSTVGLHPQFSRSDLVEVCAERRIHRKRRLHAAAIEIDAIHYLLAILRERFRRIAVELERQAAAIFEARRRPRGAC